MLYMPQDHQKVIEVAPVDSVRLYRGQPGRSAYREIPAWIRESATFQLQRTAEGRWFTDNLDEALWYARECDDGEVVFVDVAAAGIEQYRVSNIAVKPGGKDVIDNPRAFSKRPEFEFFLSAELAAQAVPFTFLEENLEQEASNSFGIR
jgi:hypothetical protein